MHQLLGDQSRSTFRAVHTVRVGDTVHVLPTFQKKSKPGISTPQPDVELLEKRLKVVFAVTGRAGERDDPYQPCSRHGQRVLDLGFDDAKERSARVALAFKLNELIDRRG